MSARSHSHQTVGRRQRRTLWGRNDHEDLVSLLLRVNGVHLWAGLDTGRVHEGLAPLSEWDLARAKMYGPDAGADVLAEQYLALTYHTDASAFVVLDVDGGGYSLMDSCGPDLTCPVLSCSRSRARAPSSSASSRRRISRPSRGSPGSAGSPGASGPNGSPGATGQPGRAEIRVAE